MTGRFRAIIADDEPLARGLLRELLLERADVEIVGEASTGYETVAAIRDRRPDLVFLDVQMPELDGFGVVAEIGPVLMPVVIFVTAYDRYALRAFDAQALDYLLKPIDADRLDRAMRRSAAYLTGSGTEQLSNRLTDLLGRLGLRWLERIPIKSTDGVRFVPVASVDWIEADRKIVRIHTGKETHVIRHTLTAFAARLDPNRFIRVHRSSVVNIESVQQIQPWFQGDYVLILKDGARVTTGKLYRDAVRRLIEEGR